MEDDEQQQYYDMYTFAKEQLRDLNQLKHLKNEIQILINGNKTNSDSKKIKVKIVTVLTKKQLEWSNKAANNKLPNKYYDIPNHLKARPSVQQ